MVTSVSLGNLFQVGDKTVFGGGSTGLDTETLITDLVEARRLPAVELEDRIDSNSAEISAFTEFRGLLNAFQTAAGFLRNPPGVANESDNIFEYRATNSIMSDGSNVSSYLDISAEPGTQAGTYDIQIDTVAERKIQATTTISGIADLNTDVVDPVAANRFRAGVLEITPGNTVTIDDDDTLNDIINKVNTISGDTGVEASAIKVGADAFRLQFSAIDTGTDADFTLDVAANTGAGGVLEEFAAGGIEDIQLAANASFSINGIPVTSQSNTVNDAIEGLSLTLRQQTPGGFGGADATITVEPDTELITSAVDNFVNAYNDLKVFVARQNLRNDDGSLLESSVLGSNPSLQTAINQIDSQLNRVVDGILGANPQSLADIGITYTDVEDVPGAGEDDPSIPLLRNVLEVDATKLQEAIATNPQGVRDVFEFSFQTDDSKLNVFSRTNAATVTEYTLDIDSTAQTATATFDTDPGAGVSLKTINLDYTELSGSLTLEGQEGTELEGLVLIYSDVADASINVTQTQGVADSVFNTLDNLTDDIEGIVQIEINSLTENNSDLQDQITRIDEQIERYRQQLLDRFTALEQAISQVNQLLQALDAQTQAQNNA